MKKVIKFNGEEAFRKDCRKIKGQFYEKNVDCFLIDGKWNRIDNGLIAFDHTLQKWVRINEFLHKGYLEDGCVGYFSHHDDIVKAGSNIFFNEMAADNAGYKPSINSEKWVPKDRVEKKAINAKYGKLPYNMNSDAIYNLTEKYNELFNKDIKDVYLRKFLEGYKFGFEFETNNGYIRVKELQKHGIAPLLDGSLRWPDGTEPYEFTTIPYQGTKGVASLMSFCDVLDTHCTFNTKCSVHVHISGYPIDRISVMALYKLLYDIETDVFKMFPAYKKDPNLIGQGKNYCNQLPNIFRNIDIRKLGYKNYTNALSSRMFRALTDRDLSDEWNYANGLELFAHTNKWNIPGRYRWVNLIPLLFSNYNTVEFRIHEPTFDKGSIVNWLIFCITLLKYAENNTDNIFKSRVKLTDILKQSDYANLVNYYNTRVDFYQDATKKGKFNDLIQSVKPVI